MKKYFFIVLILLTAAACAQDVPMISEDMSPAQFSSVIDMPTAGALHKGEYDFEMRIFPQGGILMGFTVGLFERFNMGVSYGGTEIIGNSPKIGWNDEPGVVVKYRLFEEGYTFPAVALGYSSQTYGSRPESDSSQTNTYFIKSRGLYAALSKNFRLKDRYDYSFHAGVNYNTAERDDDQGLNLFAGSELAINPELSLLLEYDFAMNDNDETSQGEKKGYMNAGVRWTFARSLLLQFNFKDLLGNTRDSATVNREIMIVYRQDI